MLLNTIYVKHGASDITPSTSVSWWDSYFPYRIPVVVDVPLNRVQEGEIVTAVISARHIEMNKINPDLSNIQVVKYKDDEWTAAPTQAFLDGENIYVEFQAVNDISDFDIYYIYYGYKRDLPRVVPDYTGTIYHNRIDPTSMYVSYTNPTEDWVYDSGHIEGGKPGAKIFAQMSVERFKINGRKGPDGGIIQIYINNLPHSVVDLYNKEEVNNVEIFSHEMVEPGSLDLCIEVLHEKNAMSTGHKIRVDSITYDTHSKIAVGTEEIYPELAWISRTGAM